jgi:WhiB family redox-sensing transcriptional regulator
MNEQQLYMKLQKEIEEAPSIPPCQTSDPEVWFGFNEEKTSYYKTAKKLCGFCPVQNTCLEYALAANEVDGVWGGLTPDERKKMRAAQQRIRQRKPNMRRWL